MKKVIWFLIFALFLAVLQLGCFAYSDISDLTLEKQAKELSELNIINGYDDGSFRPENNITRAEFSKIIMEAVINNDFSDAENRFYDVSERHWACDYIYRARYAGIINGTSETTFDPEENVTYEQAIKMIVCALGYETEAFEKGGWPNGYIKQADFLGILSNVNFVGEDFATRGNVVRMVRNALDIPFYYLNTPENITNREYSDISIYEIKRNYLDLSAEEEGDEEFVDETEQTERTNENVDLEKDSVG